MSSATTAIFKRQPGAAVFLKSGRKSKKPPATVGMPTSQVNGMRPIHPSLHRG